MVFALDFVFAMSLKNPWIVAISLFVGLLSLIEYIEAYPRQLIVMFFTPWDEYRGEDLFMWYVDAIELGLYDPMDPPMTMFDNPAARDYLVSNYADVDDLDELEETEAKAGELLEEVEEAED